MILQARTLDLHVLACTQREEPLQELHTLVHRARRRIGAEVARAVFRDAPRDHEARILVGQRDLEVRIALVILEADIVARAVLLDEVALQDQRLDLRMCEDRLEVGNLRDHGTHLRRLMLAALEVLPHAVLEDDGLADVDDAPLCVLHDVNARRIRQQPELLLHDFRHLLPLAFLAFDGHIIRRDAKKSCHNGILQTLYPLLTVVDISESIRYADRQLDFPACHLRHGILFKCSVTNSPFFIIIRKYIRRIHPYFL